MVTEKWGGSEEWVGLNRCVLVFYSCYNKLPPIESSKTTYIYYITMLEVRILKRASLSQNQDVSKAVFLSAGCREEHTPCLFQLPKTAHVLDTLRLQSQKAWMESLSHGVALPSSLVVRYPSASHFCLSFFTFKNPSVYTGSTQTVQDNLPTSKSLLTSVKSPFPCKCHLHNF